MKLVYIKDKNRRVKYNLIEKKKIILKYIINNLQLSNILRTDAYLEYLNLSLDSSITKIKNRCILTNRSKGIYKKFKISRIFFKKIALEGNLPGVKKASW
jgi:ribosomal protein S14